MRLPESKIKEAILHPETAIRQRATRYFSRAFSTDTSIMPLVIKAVETYGRDNETHRLIGAARDLLQTEATVDWLIEELNRDGVGNYVDYAAGISLMIFGTDAALLLPRESEILECPRFLPELHWQLSERFQMLSWDEAKCWEKLEKLCEKGKDKQYTTQVDLPSAHRIIEALARYGDQCEQPVTRLLSHNITDDYWQSPMKWMEPMAIRLAGEAGLESTGPLLVSKLLRDESDLLNDECMRALIRIGSPQIVEATKAAFPTADYEMRPFAVEVLENIHSDLAADTCLQLLKQEQDEEIRALLATALLHQFASEGVTEARKILVNEDFEYEGIDLKGDLIETCLITGERFPEFDEWLAEHTAKSDQRSQRMNELEGDADGQLQYFLKQLADDKAETPRPATRVGRNEACPCGSGKKYKQCCLKTNG